ncbi:hypothetical protein AB0O75_24035 [Streptomyces sp. NPDC088921]
MTLLANRAWAAKKSAVVLPELRSARRPADGRGVARRAMTMLSR